MRKKQTKFTDDDLPAGSDSPCLWELGFIYRYYKSGFVVHGDGFSAHSVCTLAFDASLHLRADIASLMTQTSIFFFFSSLCCNMLLYQSLSSVTPLIKSDYANPTNGGLLCFNTLLTSPSLPDGATIKDFFFWIRSLITKN